eukprot:549469_1
MTSIEIFNVCTHCKEGGGLSMGIPTSCVLDTHPTNADRFVTGGGDANVFIWHLSSHCAGGLESIAKLTYHTNCVNAVAWDATGDRLATSGDDKMIIIWKKDKRYDYRDSSNEPSFGESMIFKEKWMPSIKIRGPLAEVSEIKWFDSDQTIVVSTLDGDIGFYDIKRQQQLHVISINKCQFLQGIAVERTSNLLAIQSTKASCPVYRIMKHKKKDRNNYRSVQHCLLQYFPRTIKETELQKQYNEQYKLDKKAMQEMVENKDTSNTMNNTTNDPKKSNKIKKKRVSRCALFKNNLVTTTKKPGWSPDGLLLCLVAGHSRDKGSNTVHIFHRSKLAQKVATIVFPESCHATVARFGPLKLKLNEPVEKGSIVDQFNMKYRMLLSIICGSELFLFDTSKVNAVCYWKDQDTQNMFDMEWSFDCKSLLISDVEGFITRIKLSDDDVVPA